MKKLLKTYGYFTDQESFPVDVVDCVAEYDMQEPYEVDQGAVFETAGGRYIGCVISGCS